MIPSTALSPHLGYTFQTVLSAPDGFPTNIRPILYLELGQ